MRSLSESGTPHPGMPSDAEREYFSQRLTPLRMGEEDAILVPEEVAAEMQRLAAEVRAR